MSGAVKSVSIPLAVIGAGQMGQFHARVISQNPRTRLELVVDPREDVGRKVAESFNARWAPKIPADMEVDAAIVAAATEAHATLGFEIIAQGKHLLIEKPIAPSFEEVIQLTNSAKAKGLTMMCGLLERFNPAVVTAKSLIREPVHIVTTRHSPYAPRIRTGVAWDLLIHDIDLIVQFMGEAPESVSAAFITRHPNSEQASEDVAESVLSFSGQRIAQASASRIGQRKIRSLSVYEDKRLVEVDLLRRDVTIFNNVSEAEAEGGRGYKQQTVIEIPELLTNTEPLAAQLEEFINAIESSDTNKIDTYLPAHESISKMLSN